MKKKKKVASTKKSQRAQIADYLRKAGLGEAAMIVDFSKEGQLCLREGYWIRGTDDVVRCDSGNYARNELDQLRCVHCRLRAA